MKTPGKSRSVRGAGWRTGKDSGAIRFNRDFSRLRVGRITRSSRTTDPNEFRRRNDILTKLAESSQSAVLRAFKGGLITIEQLVEADREQRLKSADLLGLLKLRQPLWQVIADTLPRMGASEQTRKRYEVSLEALKRKAVASLGERAVIADLDRVAWPDVRKTWGRSGSDWNHVRRAISAFLTAALGDKYHPFRRAVVTQIPIAAEASRVPDATPAVFWEIVKHVPERYQGCFITLAVTGMRVGEYLRCTRFNLKPATFWISVPGTKTLASADGVAVPPQYWSYVEAAIPSPLGYKALRRHWKAACKKVHADLRIHDLRHCFGQWAVNAGVPEAKVQTALRHKTAAMTRRYTKAKEKGEAANAVGNALSAAEQGEAAQVAAQGGNHA